MKAHKIRFTNRKNFKNFFEKTLAKPFKLWLIFGQTIQTLINLTPKLKNVVLSKLKGPWCWERLRAGEGDDRGWDGWMASPTQRTWVWVNSGSWWWTGRPGVLRFIGSQRVGHDWATEVKWLLIIAMMQYIWSNIELLDRSSVLTSWVMFVICFVGDTYVFLPSVSQVFIHLLCPLRNVTVLFVFCLLLFLGCWGRVRHLPCPCSSRTSANRNKA